MAYEKRDAAYQAWLNANTASPLLAQVQPFEELRDAFNAGWDARKRAEYEMVVNRGKSAQSYLASRERR